MQSLTTLGSDCLKELPKASGRSRELILDISEEPPDGPVLRRHLILGDNAAILKLASSQKKEERS
jgi:hypothetical protein